jgi:hypothetical protein
MLTRTRRPQHDLPVLRALVRKSEPYEGERFGTGGTISALVGAERVLRISWRHYPAGAARCDQPIGET